MRERAVGRLNRGLSAQDRMLLLLLVAAPCVWSKSVLVDKMTECTGWAASGECTKNGDFMNSNCAAACAANPKDPVGEPEQCAGWAAQGECTRNPKYMMAECPANCKQQRASVHDGVLDERLDCIDVANNASCSADPGLQRDCAGTCLTHTICGSEADPPECEKALRCRELKDDYADCPDRVRKNGCEDAANAFTLLKHCYLSCARLDTAGLLRRYRLKYTVRTRRHGLIDEDGFGVARVGVAWRRANTQTHSVPCWKGTLFDPPPPATCAPVRLEMLHRWRRFASPRCSALKETTPRAPSRRVVQHAIPSEIRPGVATREVSGDDAAAASQPPPVRVLPIALSPKIRLVENFVTAAEAARVIEIGVPTMHRSLAGGRTESIRTSSTGMLPASDPVVRSITERAALLTGYPYEHIEPLQFLKYTEGQRYEPHFDYGEACDYEENLSNGHRHVTMLVYLNTVPEEYGGHTTFPTLNLRVSPRAHSAVVFNDCLPNGEEDPRTLHGGSPPGNHSKFAINVWIRAQSRSRGRTGFF